MKNAASLKCSVSTLTKGIFMMASIFIYLKLAAQHMPWKSYLVSEEIRDSFLLSKPEVEYAYGDVKRLPDGSFQHRYNRELSATDTLARLKNAFVRISQGDFSYSYHRVRMRIYHRDTLCLRFEFGDENYFGSMKLYAEKNRYQVIFFAGNPVLQQRYKEDSVIFHIVEDELILNRSRFSAGDSVAGIYRATFTIEENSEAHWLKSKPPKRKTRTSRLECSFRGTLRANPGKD